MKLDVILEPDLTPSQILELGLLAEKNGIRAIWAQNYSSARDAFMSLVPLAQQSKNLLIGVVILCPYEMHPIKIANATLTLNEYASGRAMVVIGAGGEWPEVMASSIFETSYGQRKESVRETLEIVSRATENSEFSYSGNHYSALRFSTQWHENQPPTIYHGACGPKMISMGAKLASGTMMSDVMPAMMESRLAILRDSLSGISELDSDYRISNFIAWHVKKTREPSFAEARRELIIRGWLEREWLEPYLPPDEVESILNNRWPFLQAWLKKASVIEGVPAHITRTLVEELTLAGDYTDIERHIDRLNKFAAAGFTEIALRVHDDPAESIRTIGELVLPRIR